MARIVKGRHPVFRMIAGTAALVIVLAMGGCNSSESEKETSQQSSDGGQSSASSDVTIDLSSRPEDGDWYEGFAQIVQINGSFNSEGEYLYDGGDIRIKARAIYAGTPIEPVSTKMVVLLDGYLHPFRFEDEEEEKMVHTFTVEQDVETFVEATITPMSMPADHFTEITVAFFFGFDTFMDENTLWNPYPSLLVPGTVRIKAENADCAREYTPDTVKIEPVETKKLEGDYSLHRIEFLIDSQWRYRYYQEVDPGSSQARLAISGPAGEHRLFLYLDGKLIQAFEGNYDAIWVSASTEEEEIGGYYDLDLSFLEGLPAGSLHNLLFVTIVREEDDQGNSRFTYTQSDYVTIKIAE